MDGDVDFVAMGGGGRPRARSQSGVSIAVRLVTDRQTKLIIN
jgi:hypothetical protein